MNNTTNGDRDAERDVETTAVPVAPSVPAVNARLSPASRSVDALSTDGEQLDAKLAGITLAIEDARVFMHEHHLGTHDTRKAPADALRIIRRWHALHGGTLQEKSEARHQEHGQPTAGEVETAACRKELSTVPVAPTVSIRVPSDLREQAEAFCRDRRWTFAKTTLVALEQLIGYDGHLDDAHTPIKEQNR